MDRRLKIAGASCAVAVAAVAATVLSCFGFAMVSGSTDGGISDAEAERVASVSDAGEHHVAEDHAPTPELVRAPGGDTIDDLEAAWRVAKMQDDGFHTGTIAHKRAASQDGLVLLVELDGRSDTVWVSADASRVMDSLREGDRVVIFGHFVGERVVTDGGTRTVYQRILGLNVLEKAWWDGHHQAWMDAHDGGA